MIDKRIEVTDAEKRPPKAFTKQDTKKINYLIAVFPHTYLEIVKLKVRRTA
jgi:hypothetical protein